MRASKSIQRDKHDLVRLHSSLLTLSCPTSSPTRFHGKPSKDKVEINEWEVKSLKKFFYNFLFRGMELMNIRVVGRKLVGEEVGHETVERELGNLVKSGLSFCILGL